jgi:amidohydrolase
MKYANLLMEAEQIKSDVIQLRRSFHMYPELSNEEERTVGIVQRTLESLGIKTQRVAGTGLVGLLEGKGQGKTVALRADMDALPIYDEKDVEYVSQVSGKMHACGHDVHTAGLLGAAMLLSKYKDHFSGNVKFFFQPAEETTGGALPMIEAGVMENPKVDGVFGLHVSPEIEVGKIGIHYGKFYAACDMLDVVIQGKESHGAAPHNGVDAIVIGSQIVSALQSFVSRNVNPIDSAVVTIGKFVGGYQRNIVADKVEISGTIRTLNPETRETAKMRLPKLIKGMAESFNAEADVQYILGYPCLINDDAMTDFLKNSAMELMGKEKVTLVENAKLGGEDFAYFLQKAPGTFYQLGVRNEAKGIIHPVHTHLFDVDEDALAIAAAVHAKVALDFLSEQVVLK